MNGLDPATPAATPPSAARTAGATGRVTTGRDQPAADRANRELFLTLAAGAFALLVNAAARYGVRGAVAPADLALPGLAVLAAIGLHMVRRVTAPLADPIIAPLALGLTGLGLAMVDRLDPRAGPAQSFWAVLGIALAAGVLFLVRRPYQLADYKYVLGITGIVLFLAPVFVGTEVGGARLWIRVGGLSLQPAEFGKIALVLFFAAYLAQKGDLLATGTGRLWRLKVPPLSAFGPLVAIWLVSLAVLVFEKDLGSSLLFFGLFLGLLYAATGRVAYVLSGTLLFAAGAAGTWARFAHVRARVDIWLDPWTDVGGAGYQVAQSLFAIAAGGVGGVGLGSGSPTKIPAVATDFVFAAIAEELGLVGALGVITAYAVFTLRALAVGASGRTRFSQLAAAGLGLSFGLQTLLIIGGVIKLVPLTGITLPFVSQGGSSLVASWLLAGLLIRFSDDAERVPG